MNALSNKAVDDFRLRVNGARAEIAGLMAGVTNSVGETQDAYKRIIKDKLWKFQQMVGEFYRTCLDSTLELQARLGVLAEPSNKPSVPPENAPSQ
jgi:methyl coenzyme M reductase subunit C-like uncharacterized protein (methanogenesis marker protein 7)